MSSPRAAAGALRACEPIPHGCHAPDAAAGPPPGQAAALPRQSSELAAATRRALEELPATAQETPTPAHVPQGAAASHFPCPAFLQRPGYFHSINIGVLGAPGAGISSLVNALRRKRPAGVAGATPVTCDTAPVGCTKTTARPGAYKLCACCFDGPCSACAGAPEVDTSRSSATQSTVRLWDMPGITSKSMESWEETVREMGFRFFDAFVLVVSRRVSDQDLYVASELTNMGVPFLVARTKVDVDIKNEAHDHSISSEAALAMLRRSTDDAGFSESFLVSARSPDGLDMPVLRLSLLVLVRLRRCRDFQHTSPLLSARVSICSDLGVPICADPSARSFEDAKCGYGSCCPICEKAFASQASAGNSVDEPGAVCRWCEIRICAPCMEMLCSGGRDKAHCPSCNLPRVIDSRDVHWSGHWWSWLTSGWVWLFS